MPQDEDDNLPEEDEGGGNYSKKSDFSKAQVVERQVSKCIEIRSQEMKESYENIDRYGNKVVMPDTRKQWVSAVKALRQLLEPEVNRSPSFQEKEKIILQRIKEVFNKWKVYPFIQVDNNYVPNMSAEPFIPNLNQVFPRMTIKNQDYGSNSKFVTVYEKGIYNDFFHHYWDDLVEVYDNLFSQIQVLIDNNDYFKQGISY